jgi:hypothetical protein
VEIQDLPEAAPLVVTNGAVEFSKWFINVYVNYNSLIYLIH